MRVHSLIDFNIKLAFEFNSSTGWPLFTKIVLFIPAALAVSISVS